MATATTASRRYFSAGSVTGFITATAPAAAEEKSRPPDGRTTSKQGSGTAPVSTTTKPTASTAATAAATRSCAGHAAKRAMTEVYAVSAPTAISAMCPTTVRCRSPKSGSGFSPACSEEEERLAGTICTAEA